MTGGRHGHWCVCGGGGGRGGGANAVQYLETEAVRPRNVWLVGAVVWGLVNLLLPLLRRPAAASGSSGTWCNQSSATGASLLPAAQEEVAVLAVGPHRPKLDPLAMQRAGGIHQGDGVADQSVAAYLRAAVRKVHGDVCTLPSQEASIHLAAAQGERTVSRVR